MPGAAFIQTSFLGGEWAPQYQGRADDQEYRTGMNVCLNVIPTEEGAAYRRPGTVLGGPTRSGAYGVLREFDFNSALPFNIELTAGHLRLWASGAGLVVHPTAVQVSGVSNANPAVVTTSGAHGLATGNQVLFTAEGVTAYSGVYQLLQRQIAVTVTGADTFTIADALTGVTIDGSLITFADTTLLYVNQIYEATTSYATGDLQQVRLVQDGIAGLLLHSGYAPQQIEITVDNDSDTFVTASVTLPVFYDGPYLDPPIDGSTLTPTGLTGTITINASATTSINSGAGFQATDVGRMVRLFSQPSAWSSSTTYSSGTNVLYQDVVWQSVAKSNNVEPDTDNGTHWVIDPSGQVWTWGTIATVGSTTSCTVTLAAADPLQIAAGGPLLYNVPITQWRLGAFSNTTGWPSAGGYFQGRLWLVGAAPNRIDACVSNDFGQNGYINFAPTIIDGTVTDASGLDLTLNSKNVQDIQWVEGDDQGVLLGTQNSEWLIRASSLGEPITATSVQAWESSRYGSLNQAVLKVGRATVFIHRYGRKIYEYLANYFTQKFVAFNLNLRTKHLTLDGVAEVAYQRELAPIIWARTNAGNLIGCTYKHDDPIKPMEFYAWHRHQLGHGRSVISIQAGPAVGGELDTLAMVTQDPNTSYCYVEFLNTLFDNSDSLLTSWFVDGGQNPAGADQVTVGGQLYLRVYGLWYMIGQSVSVWAAGLDMGDFTISSTGTIDIPVGATGSLLTTTYLAQITAGGCLTGYTDVT